MRSFPTSFVVASTFAGVLLVGHPAQAVTFANFNQVGTARTIHWVRDANTGLSALDGSLFTGPDALTHGAVAVRFNFQLAQLAEFENLSALFTVEAREVGEPVGFAPTSNTVTQIHVDGNTPTTGFSILYNGPTVVLNGHTVSSGANLLSAKFTNLWLQGVQLANAGAAVDSDPIPGTVTFTSDFLNFGASTDRGFSWDLTSVSPVYGFEAGRALPSFNASVTGSFSASLVPEASSWALMIFGFGATGAVLRRRRLVLA